MSQASALALVSAQVITTQTLWPAAKCSKRVCDFLVEAYDFAACSEIAETSIEDFGEWEAVPNVELRSDIDNGPANG